MGADVGAEVTLDTVVRVPARNIDRNPPLLIGRGSGGRRAVRIGQEGGDRQAVPLLRGDRVLDIVYKVQHILCALGLILELEALVPAVLPFLGHGDLLKGIGPGVDRSPVFLYDVLSLSAVGLLRGVLHELVRVLLRDDSGQSEEGGLENRVDPRRSHAGLDSDLHAIDDVKADLMLRHILLHLSGKMLCDLILAPAAV